MRAGLEWVATDVKFPAVRDDLAGRIAADPRPDAEEVSDGEWQQRAERAEAALQACIEGRMPKHGDMPMTFDEVHRHTWPVQEEGSRE